MLHVFPANPLALFGLKDVAVCNLGQLVLSPNPLLPCFTCSTMSQYLKADFASFLAPAGVHFLPVACLGAAAHIVVSWDLARVKSSLTLLYCYSSLRQGQEVPQHFYHTSWYRWGTVGVKTTLWWIKRLSSLAFQLWWWGPCRPLGATAGGKKSEHQTPQFERARKPGFV